MKSFILTEDQSKIVLPMIKKAEKIFPSGFPGAVIFQILRYDKKGDIEAVGDFLPYDYAKRVYDVIQEFKLNQGK